VLPGMKISSKTVTLKRIAKGIQPTWQDLQTIQTGSRIRERKEPGWTVRHSEAIL